MLMSHWGEKMKLQTPIELHVQWLKDQLNATEMVLFKIQDENARLREALQLIATPKRPDGTYNRSREACEQLARDALEGK